MPEAPKNKAVLILILGCMTALSPFSIDMYLPAFQAIAKDLNSTAAQVSLSLSSYFIGISAGQLIYGPLLDRFGRKRPLYAGLTLYILASLFCMLSRTTEQLVGWRFIQALGGCAAGVASMSMVRDLFSLKESAKVYSLLILILGASPLLAPTIGGYLSIAFGWPSVFVTLALMGLMLLITVKFFLIETHTPDPAVSLEPLPIAKNFISILKNTQFYTYVFSGAISFAGLFVYLAGSPVIFLDNYGVSAQVYGWIFATIAAGFIVTSQFNVFLLKHFTNQKLVLMGIAGQVLVGLSFLIGTHLQILNLPMIVLMFFLFFCCFGITNPNAGALSLEPFSKNAGSAAALMGFIQMGMGASASSMVAVFNVNDVFPVAGIMTAGSSVALVILLVGTAKLAKKS